MSSPHDPGPAARPPAPADQPQALRLAADVLRAVRGHWRVALLFFVLANAAVLGGIMICPRTYVSEAKMRVNPGRENSTLDATTEGSGNAMAAMTNREQDLNTAVDVLESRSVLEFAVRRIGPEPILKGYVPPEGEVGDDAGGVMDPDVEGLADAGPLVELGLSDPVSRFEKAVQTLGDILEVNSNKKSDVISVSVEAEQPALAQRICAEIVAGFRRTYTDASEIEGGSEFFAQKADQAKRELDAAAGALAEELNALGIATLDGRRQQLQEEMSRLSADEMDRRKVLEGTLAEVAGYDRLLDQTPREIAAGQKENTATGAPDTLRKEIAALEARRDKIVRETSAKAPGAVRLARQIESQEQLLKTLSEESTETSTAANPVWQNLMQARLVAKAKAEGLRAELSSLRSQRAEAEQSIAGLNRRESRILALQTERDELAKGLARYVELREQARVADEMGAQRISSVKVFQEPSFNAKPVAPKKRLIAMAGLVFASFGALGVCLVLEYRSIFFAPTAAAPEYAAAPPAGGDWPPREAALTAARPEPVPAGAANGHAPPDYPANGADPGPVAHRPR